MVFEAVRLYVEGLSSYRILSRLLGRRLDRAISRSTLNAWVDQTGAEALTPLEVSVHRAPSWGGFLGVDGKAVFIAGKEHALLVAVDQKTQDVVHVRLAPGETGEEFYRLIYELVTVAEYPLRGLIIDASNRFIGVHASYLSSLPLQLCRIHLSRHLDYAIRKNKHAPDAGLRAEVKERVREVLFAENYPKARELMTGLAAEIDRYRELARQNTLGTFLDRFELYMTHHRVPGLPADSNITENVIKQLGKKLELMEGFSSVTSAERFSRLLVGCYRFKPFTDSSNGHNGRSPLEIAGVDLGGRDWLEYLLSPK